MILTINDNNITKNDNVELIKGYIDNILKSNNKNKVLDNISFLASYLIKLNSIIHSNYKDQVKLSFKDDDVSIEIVNFLYEVLWSINKDQNLVIEFFEQLQESNDENIYAIEMFFNILSSFNYLDYKPFRNEISNYVISLYDHLEEKNDSEINEKYDLLNIYKFILSLLGDINSNKSNSLLIRKASSLNKKTPYLIRTGVYEGLMSANFREKLDILIKLWWNEDLDEDKELFLDLIINSKDERKNFVLKNLQFLTEGELKNKIIVALTQIEKNFQRNIHTLPIEYYLNNYELDLAMYLLQKHGLSEFFPKPYEINLMKENWNDYKNVFRSINLEFYECKPLVMISTIKNNNFPRPVCLLDPFDWIIYTSLTLKLSNHVEKQRQIFEQKNVYSFILNINNNNIQFYNNWERYIIDGYVKSKKYKYFVITDISDFFPSIDYDILEINLKSLVKSEKEIDLIIKLLKGWKLKNKLKGLPIGPIASNYIAECYLLKIDQFLIENKVIYIRFVDDFIIFGKSLDDCKLKLSLLAKKLCEELGLFLNSSKTIFLKSQEYKSRFYLYLEKENLDEIINKINNDEKIIINFSDSIAFESIDILRLFGKNINFKESVNEILEKLLNREIRESKTIRLILYFLSEIDFANLLKYITLNMTKLSEYSKEIATILIKAINSKQWNNKTSAYTFLESFLNSYHTMNDYQKIWLIEVLRYLKLKKSSKKIINLFKLENNLYIKRQLLLASKDYLNDDTIRTFFENTNEFFDEWLIRGQLFVINESEYKYLLERENVQKLVKNSIKNTNILVVNLYEWLSKKRKSFGP